MKVLVILHPPIGRSGGDRLPEVIGPFVDDAAIDAFEANEAMGQRGWTRVEVQSPESVIEYLKRRY